MAWSLDFNGDIRSFENWGLKLPSITFANRAQDICTLHADGAAFDADELFPYGSTIKIFRDSTPWFYGRVIHIPRAGASNHEEMAYTVAGPWWWLDETIFQVLWPNFGQVPGNVNTSHILLNFSNAGFLSNTIDQITSILQYAIARGAPIQIGSILPGTATYPPVDEVRDITCAEALRRELRWHPDSIAWFDYSTTPPTLHIKTRDQLSERTLSLPPAATGDSVVLSSAGITPRYDLQRPSVVVKYERTNQVNNQDYFNLLTEIAPPSATGLEVGAFISTINLAGFTAQVLEATIETEDIIEASLDWWKIRVPALADPRVCALSITPGSISRKPTSLILPRRLVRGQIADWMNFQSEDERITARFNFTLLNQDNLHPTMGCPPPNEPPPRPPYSVIATAVDEIIDTDLVATDAVSGDYQSLASFTSGDPQPIGLATALYNALSILHYEGSVTLTEDEVTGQVHMGHLLNLSGSRHEWDSMASMVQQVTQNIDDGITTLHFGPPDHLGPADLVDLLRVNRPRYRFTNTTAYTTGSAASNTLTLGKETPNDSSVRGEKQLVRLVLFKPGGHQLALDAENHYLFITGGLGTVILDADQAIIPGTMPPQGLTIELRETEICEGGVARKALVFRSTTYD